MKNLGIMLWIFAVVLWTVLLALFIHYEANRAIAKINDSTAILLETYEPIIVEE